MSLTAKFRAEQARIYAESIKSRCLDEHSTSFERHEAMKAAEDACHRAWLALPQDTRDAILAEQEAAASVERARSATLAAAYSAAVRAFWSRGSVGRMPQRWDSLSSLRAYVASTQKVAA